VEGGRIGRKSDAADDREKRSVPDVITGWQMGLLHFDSGKSGVEEGFN
jgi:hypothetical protein